MLYEHSYKPITEFYKRLNDKGLIPLFLGVEDEINHCTADRFEYTEFLDNTVKMPLYCKKDSSIGPTGVEIVTHPCTLGYHTYNFSWKWVFKAAKKRGFEPSDDCGLHVHFNREYINNDKRVIGKIIVMLHQLRLRGLLEFTRRSRELMDYWAEDNCVPRWTRAVDDDAYLEAVEANNHNTRYLAVNLMNTTTVELRVFKSTMDRDTMIATLQFVSNLVNYAKNCSLQQARHVTMLELCQMNNYPELTKYASQLPLSQWAA